MQQDSSYKWPLLKVGTIRKIPFASLARKTDIHFAFILKTICHPGIFLPSAYLEIWTYKVAATGLEIRLSFLFFVAKLSRASLFLHCVIH